MRRPIRSRTAWASGLPSSMSSSATNRAMNSTASSTFQASLGMGGPPFAQSRQAQGPRLTWQRLLLWRRILLEGLVKVVVVPHQFGDQVDYVPHGGRPIALPGLFAALDLCLQGGLGQSLSINQRREDAVLVPLLPLRVQVVL